MNRRLFLISLLAATLCLLWAPAGAHEYGHEEAKELVESGKILPLETVVKSAEKLKRGKLLEAELHEKRNLLIYKVEVLDEDGVVWEFKFNAASGELIEMEMEED